VGFVSPGFVEQRGHVETPFLVAGDSIYLVHGRFARPPQTATYRVSDKRAGRLDFDATTVWSMLRMGFTKPTGSPNRLVLPLYRTVSPYTAFSVMDRARGGDPHDRGRAASVPSAALSPNLAAGFDTSIDHIPALRPARTIVLQCVKRIRNHQRITPPTDVVGFTIPFRH